MAFLQVDRALCLPRRPVADGRVDHLAGAHHVLQRAHHLVDRCHRIEAVQEQHVDAVGLQAPEARLDGLTTWRREAPRALTSGLVGLKHLVVSTRSSRWLFASRPRISSDLPLLYSLAQSKKLMPASRMFP